jgi:hypothetical protein
MFFGHNLSRSTTPQSLSSGVAAGSGDTQTSSVLNVGQDLGAYFFVQLGTVATGGSGVIKLQQSNDNGVSDPYADVAGSGQTFSATNSGHGFVVDVYRPQKQYFQVVIVRNGGGNTTIASIFALQYHVGVAPEAPGTNVDGVVWLNSPGPGAA